MTVLCACAAASPPALAQGARDRLREIVQDECLPNWRGAGDPSPCASVTLLDGTSLPSGFAVLADRKGGAHFLLIPTRTVTGIESPEARRPGEPNYFAAAWAARAVLAHALGFTPPPGAVGLALNHEDARSQDQLHIHISCLRASVSAALQAQAAQIGPR